MSRFFDIVFILALIIGVGGRLWGSWVNNESNDDHVKVVQRILGGESIAHKDSCWECFQPPLFYQAHAKLSLLTGAESRRELIQQMQMVNALFSLLSIWLIYLVIRRLFGWSLLTKGAMSFVLLNPAMFSMGIQGTNDTPVILFATLCMYWLLEYMDKSRWQTLALVGVSAFMAALIKGSGLAIFLMYSFWLIALTIHKKQWFVLSIPVLAIAFLTFFSHYTHNYRMYGNAFETNLTKTSPPPFFDDGKEFNARPGITSVWNSYGHFRFFDMLKTPYNINVNEGPNFPRHRTSFWSQLYGSFYDIQFLQHPYSWEDKHPDRLNMVRFIFILGLLTLIPISLGILHSFKNFRNFRDLINISSPNFRQVVCLSILMGMLLFTIKYSYDYRDFGCIKALFMLPVILPMLLLFIDGWKFVKTDVGRKLGIGVFGTLLLLLAADVLFLVVKLTQIDYGFIVIV